MLRNITDIKREPISAVLSSLKSDSSHTSADHGIRLLHEARSAGLNLRDYLDWKIDLNAGEPSERARYLDANGRPIGGYAASLRFLNLPLRDDLANGIVLQAAGETFQRYPGTRMMFPEVIDDTVRWKYRQTLFETTGPMVFNTRTIAGTEMIRTTVDDAAEDYTRTTVTVAEMGRVPVQSIRTSQTAVAMFKHGTGYRFSYEFDRRANIDLITPYAVRIERQMETSKVAQATGILVSGDGVSSASPITAQSSFNSAVGTNSTNGTISYKHLLRWLVERAKAGVPVDTVVGNWDAYIQWLMLFTVPTTNGLSKTDTEILAAQGFQLGGVPILQGKVDFVLSSTMTANHLLGYSRGDTLEELVEANSFISESERSIGNQTVTYIKTAVTGYSLVFGDTRSTFNFGG